jgi:hypothetical protein
MVMRLGFLNGDGFLYLRDGNILIESNNVNGTSGTQGPTGSQSATGPTGNTGPTGSQGATGPQGVSNGTNYSDYIYWNTVTGKYEVESSGTVHIGKNAGRTGMGARSIAIGENAGNVNLGANAIAIGNQAGPTGQAANSILLNASGTGLNPASSGLYVSPIRDATGSTGTYPVSYNKTTNEVYNNVGNLVVGGNLTIQGSIVNVGSTQIRAQSITSYTGSFTGNTIPLSGAAVIGGIVYYSDGTSNGFTYAFPTYANLISAGATVGSIFQVILACNSISKFNITVDATGIRYGSGEALANTTLRTVILQMNNNNTYSLYV